MANRIPIVTALGQLQQLQDTDTLFVDLAIAVRENEYEVGTDAALYVENTGSASSSVIRGIHARSIQNDDAGAPGAAASTAIYGEAVYEGSDNIDHIVGVQAFARHEGTGTLDVMQGLRVETFNDGNGVLTDLQVIYVQRPLTTTGIVNAYGIVINDMASVGSAQSWAIYGGTGRYRFADNTNIHGFLGVGLGDTLASNQLHVFDTAAIVAKFETDQTTAQVLIEDGADAQLILTASGTFGHFIFGAGAFPVQIATNSTARWEFDAAGHFIPAAHDTYDIGEAATRPRDIYIQDTANVGGLVGIGLGSTAPAVVLDTAASETINQWIAATYFTDSNGSIIRYRKANGTIGTPLVIADGDTLGVFSFEGYRDGAFPSSVTQGSALFEARVVGTVSGDSVPGAFLFQVTNVGDSTNTLALYVAPNRSIGIVSNTNQMPTGGGAPVLTLVTAGSAPTGMQANTSAFYCDAFGTNTGEMYAINSNGDSTLLTDVHYPTAGYGAGTNYTLTDTYAEVDRGTTDSVITVAHPGEFMIRAGVVLFYNGATFAPGDTISLKVRNTTDGADIAGTEVTLEAFALTTFTGSIQVQLPEVTWQNVNTNRDLAIFAQVDAEPTAGSLEISADWLVAYKRQ